MDFHYILHGKQYIFEVKMIILLLQFLYFIDYQMDIKQKDMRLKRCLYFYSNNWHCLYILVKIYVVVKNCANVAPLTQTSITKRDSLRNHATTFGNCTDEIILPEDLASFSFSIFRSHMTHKWKNLRHMEERTWVGHVSGRTFPNVTLLITSLCTWVLSIVICAIPLVACLPVFPIPWLVWCGRSSQFPVPTVFSIVQSITWLL